MTEAHPAHSTVLMSAFHSPPWLNLICRPPDPQNPRQ
jgi:hypothetical protein